MIVSDTDQSYSAAFDRFLANWPEYETTRRLDDLRASEYHRLDADGHVYLDYTGASLYGESQVRRHAELLGARVLGNPHSANLTSAATTALVEETRERVRQWFGAAALDYVVVFTTNATGAIKLVGESYPFGSGSRYLATFDNHNSVNGIRAFAAARGASVAYAPLTRPDLRLDLEALRSLLAAASPDGPNLFAFPAQSNFSGVKHPLALVAEAERAGWDVLLDAAAFVPTNRLDLSEVRPAFVSVSFYKMFGYPTGVGCLLVRSDVIGKLRRPWFAGGTVNFATVQGRLHLLSPNEAGFEDGTLDFLSIPAVSIGLDHLAAFGIETIATRVRCLTGWLLRELLALDHDNGHHMVRIYGPVTTDARGGTVTLNLYDPAGRLLDYRRVEELASLERISLRTGCFCNPGAGETAEGLTEDDMRAAVEEDHDMTLPRFLRFMTHRGGKSAGAVRVSLGLASNFADVHRFLTFLERFRNQGHLAIGEVTFDVDACRVLRSGS